MLLSRGQSQEAVQLYRVNCQLYPESSRAFARLAGALGRTGEAEEARAMAERALQLNTDPDRVSELLALLEQAGE